MEQIRIGEEEFSQLLEKLDFQYRENCRLTSRLAESDKENAAHKDTIATLEQKIFDLQGQVSYLMRRLWGKSNEQQKDVNPFCFNLFHVENSQLTEEEIQAAKDAVEEIETYRKKTIKARPKLIPVRKSLPEHLPRKEEHHFPDTGDQEVVSELPPEITEVLEHEPGRCYVRKIIRHKYILKEKEDLTTPIVTAPLPALPLARSQAGATLLSELMVNKYVDHLPFYRQIQMFRREGLDLPPSTINGWFKDTIDLLRPMYCRLQELVLDAGYIQADETTVPVIIKEKGKAEKKYFWVFRSVPDSLLFFHYNNGSRAQKVVMPILANYQGTLQTDGYDVYSIYENKPEVTLLGCWAHARRKYVEALNSDKERAEYALSQIGLLYSVESEADAQNMTREERAGLRNRLSKPVITVLHDWLLMEYPKVLPKSPIGKAIKYSLNQYPRLKRYLLDGEYLIDNNLIENSIRPVALGRKNFLFCGNHSAAEDAAVIFSLMGCCKASQVNFRQWLTHVLNNIHSYDNDYSRDLAELLPHNQTENFKIRAVS